MPNPIKGEVDIKDEDQTYRLVLDFNAFIEAEVVLGMKMNAIQAELNSGDVSMSTLRAILFGALREHHSEMSLLDTGRLMGRVGMEAIGEALQAAFPDAPEGAKQNPPKRARPRGTGKRST